MQARCSADVARFRFCDRTVSKIVMSRISIFSLTIRRAGSPRFQIKEVDFDDWEDFSACTLCHAAVGWYRSVDSRTEGVVGALNTLLRRSR